MPYTPGVVTRSLRSLKNGKHISNCYIKLPWVSLGVKTKLLKHLAHISTFYTRCSHSQPPGQRKSKTSLDLLCKTPLAGFWTSSSYITSKLSRTIKL